MLACGRFAMTRAEFVQRLILNSMCDDFENLDQVILRDVAEVASKCGLTVEAPRWLTIYGRWLERDWRRRMTCPALPKIPSQAKSKVCRRSMFPKKTPVRTSTQRSREWQSTNRTGRGGPSMTTACSVPIGPRRETDGHCMVSGSATYQEVAQAISSASTWALPAGDIAAVATMRDAAR